MRVQRPLQFYPEGKLAVTRGAVEGMWTGQRTPVLDGDLMGAVGKESCPKQYLDKSICSMIYIGKDRVG